MRAIPRVLGLAVIVAGLGLTGCAPSSGPAPDAADRACVRGTVEYTLASAEDGGAEETSPARSSAWQLWAATTQGGERALVVQGEVAADGGFEGCAQGAGLIDAQLRLRAERPGLWRVIGEGPGSEVAEFRRDVGTVAAGAEREMGVIPVPADRAGAWRIADAVTDLYRARATDSPCWSARRSSGCSAVTFVWPARDPADAGFWDPESGRIVLAAQDPASRHLILHELGHWWQNELYDGAFPEVTDCSPHYVDQPSSPSCAWTEGFADAVAAHVLGDRRFVSPDGTSTAFEAGGGAPWPGGDSTQGDVGAALLDLWALPGAREGWAASVAFMTGRPSADLGAYVADRYPRRPAAVTRILSRHGIDLG